MERVEDSGTISSAMEVLEGRSKKNWLARLLPFLGPAFIASVAYVDPGNFATNIQGGAKYGYMLIWVIIASNLMAMLVQTLSAKLGIATGKNLAEMLRDHYPRQAGFAMWILMEAVAMATDLAEFLGAALGIYLLFPGVFDGIGALTGLPPLLLPAVLMGFLTFAILSLERHGFRPLEVAITIMVGVIAFSYLIETVIDKPDWAAITHAIVQPRFDGVESVLLAAGILGATVMPHAIFLHSGLTQGRIVTRDPALLKRLFNFEVADVLIAMTIAGLVNAAMLIMAASTFHGAGLTEVGSIEEAHRTLEPLLGSAASVVFAISLLASGYSSSAVGTMAGQIIMQGFVHRKIPVWLRRGLTMLPAFVVIAMRLNPTDTLVISQVLLSFGLPFAIIPLVVYTSRKDIMGVLVNRRITTIAASGVAALIVALNLFLVAQLLFKF
ncbi:MAG TPA: Nramp family divalent metal transporter [Thermoflexales bacterium]|nr:Nramp family divalent metal transporter [Thermoflexales bacterium]HQW34434.1 Nramp family divalent metal transporter [Thermoflexales bacterium]HQZ99902.1 Nramp family divalent metal transporter [Thermoflexales bacterium]